jgi:hypothetical protein
VIELAAESWRPAELFPDKDPRTAGKLSEIGGLNTPSKLTLKDFVRRQRFIVSPHLRETLIEVTSSSRCYEIAFDVPADEQVANRVNQWGQLLLGGHPKPASDRHRKPAIN